MPDLLHDQRAALPHNLAAGLSFAAVALPVGVADAPLAGFDPVVGLYLSRLPLVAYALFGTSRHPTDRRGPANRGRAVVAGAGLLEHRDMNRHYPTLEAAVRAIPAAFRAVPSARPQEPSGTPDTTASAPSHP
ncbi:SulP family inorganic anion transporter [Thiocystis minor]|uniref:SulP family inorganic anion transporter n=1 Tax=Thiocystis minor TaxID=61597 RepID=UPI001F5C8BCD|nr:SulP family inorganic anion transporter [Thiocystis minor]